MDAAQIRALAQQLADHRRRGTVSDMRLDIVADADDARAVRAAADDAFADDLIGYSVVGTCAAVRRSLGLAAPIFGTIADRAVIHADHARFRIPAGFIGVQCEFVFTFGPLPPDLPLTDRAALEACLVGCQPAIGLLGRRSTPPQSQFGAWADYALHVATICGRYREHVLESDLAGIRVRARIDGHEVASAPASAAMDHPLNVVTWLADALQRDGGSLGAGDIVATGSCTPLLQVLPGQRLEVDFGPVGQICCDFE